MEPNQSSSNWLTCSITSARLSSIDPILQAFLDPEDPEFNEIVFQLVKMGGKKIRPSLFLLSATFGDHYDNDFLRTAAALELIHVASLYHDDVMDRADLRRKLPSANNLWGNSNATYAGNYLFSKAIEILTHSGSTINKITCHYVSDLCLGQLKEAENAFNLHLTKEVYTDIIGKKTGSLFELPCILGATLAGANSQMIEALTVFSRELGIAFQMMDDLLDLAGDPDKTGKCLGTDLKEGVYSYATLHALRSPAWGPQLGKILLLEDFTKTNIEECIQIIASSGGMEAAKRIASQRIDKARKAIAFFPENDPKRSLMNLADFVFSRSH